MTDDERELEMLEEFDRQRDRLQQALRNVAATIRYEMREMTPEGKAWLLYGCTAPVLTQWAGR